MVAPDSYESLLTRHRTTSTTVRVGLAVYPEPSHLPLFAARDWDIATDQGLALVLDATGDHAARLAALEAGRCDVIAAEPLFLLDPAVTGAEPIGCFFTGSAGVLARTDRLVKLRDGELVRVATAAASETMERLCRRIFQGWAGNRGFAVAETQITLEPGGTDPVEDLRRGYDAVWPALAGLEGVRAALGGMETTLLTAEDAGLPGFAALELVAAGEPSDLLESRWTALVAAVEIAIRRLQADPARALALWRAIAGDRDDAEAIITATLPCFRLPVDRNPARWRALGALLRDR